MSDWKHIVIFDRPLPLEKQAEGVAVNEAIVDGHCDRCGFLQQCHSCDSFRPPLFTYCMKRKAEILKEWENKQSNGRY